MVFLINQNQSGLDDVAELPGWQYGSTGSLIEDHSYGPGETPCSRAVFTTSIQRDTASTILKFFLPILLIVLVSLSSLLMKVSSRPGLNAPVFLAAVLIHWRVADAIPLVAYATFLNFFMIITYATLVMVLVFRNPADEIFRGEGHGPGRPRVPLVDPVHPGNINRPLYHPLPRVPAVRREAGTAKPAAAARTTEDQEG